MVFLFVREELVDQRENGKEARKTGQFNSKYPLTHIVKSNLREELRLF